MVGKPKVSTTKSQSSRLDDIPLSKRKSPTRSKSPARRSSPARSKSLGRSKSPGRTKKGPDAKTPSPRRKSPSRASPSRSKTSPSRIRTSPSRSKNDDNEKGVKPKRQHIILADSGSDSDGAEVKLEVKEKPKAAVRGRTRKIDSEIAFGKQDNINDYDEIQSYSLYKRVTRAQNREIERIKSFDDDPLSLIQKIGEFSDDDEVAKHKSMNPLPIIHDEFGGSPGAVVLMIGLTAYMLLLHVSCDDFQCSFTSLPNFQKYKSVSTLFDAKAFLGYIAYVTIVALLSALPFGGPEIDGFPNKHKKLRYMMNGLFSALMVLSGVIGIHFAGIPIATFIANHIFQLLIASLLFGHALAVYAYIRSFYVPIAELNTFITGKSGAYSFFMGREVNPRVFGILDLKMFMIRLSIIGAILVNFAYLVAAKPSESTWLDFLQSNPTLVVYLAFQTVYYLDPLIFESFWVNTFEIQQEGFGFMSTVGYVVYPFMSASIAKYIIGYSVKLSTTKLVISCLVFLLGYFFYRGSNNQKYNFRRNPYSPQFQGARFHQNGMHGKRILASGFWAVVRHPNYLGDILMNLALVPFLYLVPPISVVLLIVGLLIHRAERDNARCSQRYGSLWEMYCMRVKRKVIPLLY